MKNLGSRRVLRNIDPPFIYIACVVLSSVHKVPFLTLTTKRGNAMIMSCFRGEIEVLVANVATGFEKNQT